MLSSCLPASLLRRAVGAATIGLTCGIALSASADIAPPPGNRPAAGSAAHDPLAGPAAGGAQVSGGSIDREVIRRVIRRHINEIRFCYEKELAKNPGLAGHVAVSFRVATSGAVDKSEIKSSTLNNAAVESCIAGRVLTWVFPAPVGGPVAITYPFVLRGADDAPPGEPSGAAAVPPASAKPTAPPAAPPGAPMWFTFAAYPGARLLCHEHVRGAGPRPMEIEWFLFASPDPVAKVVAAFERQVAAKASTDAERGGLDFTSARDARDKLSIFPREKAAGYPHCKSAARAGEHSLILVSRGIGG